MELKDIIKQAEKYAETAEKDTYAIRKAFIDGFKCHVVDAKLKPKTFLTDEILIKAGFKETKGEHPYDTSYDFSTDKFRVYVDAFLDVQICRLNPESDYIPLQVTDESALSMLMSWLEDDATEKETLCIICTEDNATLMCTKCAMSLYLPDNKADSN